MDETCDIPFKAEPIKRFDKKKYQQEYYLKNKDKYVTYFKNKYQCEKQSRIEYQKDYYQKHKEEIKLRIKKDINAYIKRKNYLRQYQLDHRGKK